MICNSLKGNIFFILYAFCCIANSLSSSEFSRNQIPNISKSSNIWEENLNLNLEEMYKNNSQGSLLITRENINRPVVNNILFATSFSGNYNKSIFLPNNKQQFHKLPRSLQTYNKILENKPNENEQTAGRKIRNAVDGKETGNGSHAVSYISDEVEDSLADDPGPLNGDQGEQDEDKSAIRIAEYDSKPVNIVAENPSLDVGEFSLL